MNLQFIQDGLIIGFYGNQVVSYWSPMNIKSVWNRGIETSSNIYYQLGKGDINFSLKTAYNLSTNQDSYSNNDAYLGKQLIYAPHYKFIVKS